MFVNFMSVMNDGFYCLYQKMKRFDSYEPQTVTEPVLQPPIASTGLCDYCQLSSQNNSYGQPEDLLVCKDCPAKGMYSNSSYNTFTSFSYEIQISFIPD